MQAKTDQGLVIGQTQRFYAHTASNLVSLHYKAPFFLRTFMRTVHANALDSAPLSLQTAC